MKLSLNPQQSETQCPSDLGRVGATGASQGQRGRGANAGPDQSITNKSVLSALPRGYSGLGSTALGKTLPPGKRPLPAHLVLVRPQGGAVLRGWGGGGGGLVFSGSDPRDRCY